MRRNRDRALEGAKAPMAPSAAGEPHRIVSPLDHTTREENRGAYEDVEIRVVCSCGWEGPWRSLGSERRLRQDRERHLAVRAPSTSAAGEPHRIVSPLEGMAADLAMLGRRYGFQALSPEELFLLAGVVLDTFEKGKVPATTETDAQARRRERKARKVPARTEGRTVILYGQLPAPVYVLRIPEGVRWVEATRAMNRLVKRLTNTPKHKPSPQWHLDGDAPDWETTKQPRFIYNVDLDEFEEP